MKDGMLDYKCTREQRNAVRNHMGRLKLFSGTVNQPDTIEINRKDWAILVRYAYDLDYMCRTEGVIGEE